MCPFEKLFHQSSDYQFLHTIGCECFPLLRPYSQHKLLPRAESCVFLGYSSLHKGYKCYHLPTQDCTFPDMFSLLKILFYFLKLPLSQQLIHASTKSPTPSQFYLPSLLLLFRILLHHHSLLNILQHLKPLTKFSHPPLLLFLQPIQ
jgi:hypothetical protein